MLATCPGVVVTDTNGAPLCQDELGAPLAWEQHQEFDVADLDVALASGAFGAGFVIVGIGMAVGMGFRLVLSLLK